MMPIFMTAPCYGTSCSLQSSLIRWADRRTGGQGGRGGQGGQSCTGRSRAGGTGMGPRQGPGERGRGGGVDPARPTPCPCPLPGGGRSSFGGLGGVDD